MLPGVSTSVAGLIIANAAALGAFGLLRALVEREESAAVARRSLLYLAVFPTAFFLLAAYAESLFLLWSVACFLALRRQRNALIIGASLTMLALLTVIFAIGGWVA